MKNNKELIKLVKKELKELLPDRKIKISIDIDVLQVSIEGLSKDKLTRKLSKLLHKYEQCEPDYRTETHEYTNIRKDIPQVRYVMLYDL